jgi:hypothetical protein
MGSLPPLTEEEDAMPTPVEFLNKYRSLNVSVLMEDPSARVSRMTTVRVELKKYFINTNDASSNSPLVAANSDPWFQANKARIRTAVAGKGSPKDYEIALEWAVRKNLVAGNQTALQTYSDKNMGIDCSGFVENYLASNGKCAAPSYSACSPAASFYNAAQAINDPSQVRHGDLLVWMTGNAVKQNPGHVAVLQSYRPISAVAGNMSVIEATSDSPGERQLVESMYAVEGIIPKGGAVPVMMFVVKRHNVHGRVCVIRR